MIRTEAPLHQHQQRTESGSVAVFLYCRLFFFSSFACIHESVERLYCSTVSRIMHVDTGGEAAAGGSVNALAAAPRVLFNQDEFDDLDCHTVTCSFFFSLISAMFIVCWDKRK